MESRPFPQRVARLGEYFALAGAAGDGWRPIDELYDDAVLTDLVGATRAAMARYAAAEPTDVPARVAASSLHLSVASRLVSPVMGGFATRSGVPVLTPDVLRWRRAGHAVQFAAGPLPWVDTQNPATAAESVDRTLLVAVLQPLAERLDSEAGLSPKIMWGNVMSAANGAVTVMGLRDATLVPAGRELVGSLMQRPRLRGSASMTGSTFRRRSCCLFYLAPGGGLCGDCVLADPTDSH